MKIYNYADNGEFLDESDARVSPRNPEKFMIPGNATVIAPPVAQEGFARVFADGSWSQVEDHRGDVVYSKADASPHVVEDIGPIDDEYTTVEPLPGQSWIDGQWVYGPEYLAFVMENRRKYRAMNYQYGPIVIQLGDGQRADLTALYQRWESNTLPVDFVLPWSEAAYAGTEHETIFIQRADIGAFCLGAFDQRTLSFVALAQAKPQIDTCATPDDVIALFDAVFATLV